MKLATYTNNPDLITKKELKIKSEYFSIEFYFEIYIQYCLLIDKNYFLRYSMRCRY